MLAKTTLTAFAATLALSTAADARSLEDAKASGRLIVGIQADNCPWGCLGSTGEAQGFDAAVARAFAAHLGLEAEFVPMAVANRIPALTTDKVDVLIASLGITAERAQSVQFSQPYAENTLFVTAAKSTDLPDLASLAGRSVGVPRSTPMDTILTAEAPPETRIQRFDDDAANIQALVSGQVEAVGSNQFYIQRLEAARPANTKTSSPSARCTRASHPAWARPTGTPPRTSFWTPSSAAMPLTRPMPNGFRSRCRNCRTPSTASASPWRGNRL